MSIALNIKYHFNNTRGTEEAYLIAFDESGEYYRCTYYTKDGLEVRDGKFRKDGQFCQSLVGEPLKKFYIVWVEGSHLPPKVKYKTLKEAKTACEHLIENRGVKGVYIMQKVGSATAPLSVKFKMDK